MAVYSDNLATMVGRVRMAKPNAPQSQIRAQLNDRIRHLIDAQPFWADLLANGMLSMPAAYVAGSISLANNSKVVTGASTVWPVSDISNTTISDGVPELGVVLTVTPADMTGIVTDSFLYIDSAGDPESVAVIETTATTFTAKFTKRHNAACTVTQSSLAGLQLKISANTPIYTVRGVHSATELEIDVAWGLGALSGAAYQILKIYFTIAPDLKDIVNIWDPIQGRPLTFHKSQDWLNFRDPQRMSTGVPMCLADFIPSEAGSMRYELWPHQTIAYQIPILYCKQWPELKNPTDRPPWFINPSMIIDGAVADALRIRNPMGDDGVDPFFDPKTAQIYEEKFTIGKQAALNANEGKALVALEQYRQFSGFMPGGTWAQSHLSDDFWDA